MNTNFGRSVYLTRNGVVNSIANCFSIFPETVRSYLDKEYPKAFFPFITQKEYTEFVKKYRAKFTLEKTVSTLDKS